MRLTSCQSARTRAVRCLFSSLAFLAIIGICSSDLFAQKKGGGGTTTTATLVRVEEDWELIVLEPDPNNSGPQVCCVISPNANADSLHATIELNHHSLTASENGGLQLQVWDGAARLGPVKAVVADTLTAYGETVTWTTSMRVKDGALTFELLGGDSTTWGTFGTDNTSSSSGGGGFGTGGTTSSTPGVYPVDDDSSKTTTQTTDDPFYSVVTTTKTNLAAYNPQVSVDESGVSYGANLVQSLKLKAVRRYMSDGTKQTDSTVRVVYQSN